MTTASLLLLLFIAVLGIALLNLFLWGLEFIGAFAQVLLSYLLQKPHDYHAAYQQIRLMFTHIISCLSFASYSPRKYLQLEQPKLYHSTVKKAQKASRKGESHK